MKIALINDTHFGTRNDSQILLDHQQVFFDAFFKTLEKEKPDVIIHAGDLVDRRKYINYNTASRIKSIFLDPCLALYKKRGTKLVIITGNHDIFYKDTADINALHTLIGNEGVEVHIDPVVVEAGKLWNKGSTDIVLLPWICDQNREKSMKTIDEANDSSIVIGHLEMQGAEMYRGHFSDHGMSIDPFIWFKRVFSGHFHQKSTIGNIEYLGAPYEMSWSDFDCLRGFHFYDTETNDLTFIRNKESIFLKIMYDDSKFSNPEEMKAHIKKLPNIKNKFCRLIVVKKDNPYLFDAFVTELESQSPFNLRIVEGQTMFEMDVNIDVAALASVDPLSVLINHCSSEKYPAQVEAVLKDLYNRAQAVTV